MMRIWRRLAQARCGSHAAAAIAIAIDFQRVGRPHGLANLLRCKDAQRASRGAPVTGKPDVQSILDTEAVCLVYHPLTKIVHHEIRRFVHGAEFRDILEQGLKAFRKHGAYKWLSDNRRNGPLKPADGDWAVTNWGPRVMAAGWKYWAVVMPEKVIAQMNMRRWIDTYAEKGVTVQAFTDPDEAMAWLEAQP
jgi:hypothetical protein